MFSPLRRSEAQTKKVVLSYFPNTVRGLLTVGLPMTVSSLSYFAGEQDAWGQLLKIGAIRSRNDGRKSCCCPTEAEVASNFLSP